MSNLKIVVGGLVVKDGKLAIVREKKKEIAGLWNLPVGGLEENEKVADGAKREIEEETGLKIKLEKLVGVYQNPRRPDSMNVLKFLFLASVVSGTLKCPPDLQEVKWISFEDFKKVSDSQLREAAAIRMAIQDYETKSAVSLKYYS